MRYKKPNKFPHHSKTRGPVCNQQVLWDRALRDQEKLQGGGGIRTHEITVLQTVALVHLATPPQKKSDKNTTEDRIFQAKRA